MDVRIIVIHFMRFLQGGFLDVCKFCVCSQLILIRYKPITFETFCSLIYLQLSQHFNLKMLLIFFFNELFIGIWRFPIPINNIMTNLKCCRENMQSLLLFTIWLNNNLCIYYNVIWIHLIQIIHNKESNIDHCGTPRIIFFWRFQKYTHIIHLFGYLFNFIVV